MNQCSQVSYNQSTKTQMQPYQEEHSHRNSEQLLYSSSSNGIVNSNQPSDSKATDDDTTESALSIVGTSAQQNKDYGPKALLALGKRIRRIQELRLRSQETRAKRAKLLHDRDQRTRYAESTAQYARELCERANALEQEARNIRVLERGAIEEVTAERRRCEQLQVDSQNLGETHLQLSKRIRMMRERLQIDI